MCLVTAATILKTKKLKQNHSNFMIAMLCIFNFGVGWSALVYAVGAVDVIAYLRIDHIYILTWRIIYFFAERVVNLFAFDWFRIEE